MPCTGSYAYFSVKVALVRQLILAPSEKCQSVRLLFHGLRPVGPLLPQSLKSNSFIIFPGAIEATERAAPAFILKGSSCTLLAVAQSLWVHPMNLQKFVGIFQRPFGAMETCSGGQNLVSSLWVLFEELLGLTVPGTALIPGMLQGAQCRELPRDRTVVPVPPPLSRGSPILTILFQNPTTHDTICATTANRVNKSSGSCVSITHPHRRPRLVPRPLLELDVDLVHILTGRRHPGGVRGLQLPGSGDLRLPAPRHQGRTPRRTASDSSPCALSMVSSLISSSS